MARHPARHLLPWLIAISLLLAWSLAPEARATELRERPVGATRDIVVDGPPSCDSSPEVYAECEALATGPERYGQWTGECQEDMECWDCETMGNRICRPIAPALPDTAMHQVEDHFTILGALLFLAMYLSAANLIRGFVNPR